MTEHPEISIDLPAYLRRIDYSESPKPDLQTLRGLHLAHVTHIPFENLDVLLRRPILLDLESLQAKLVSARRGGYCFEQNGLFSAVLEQLGFSVVRLLARVRLGTTRLLPRTHMLAKVEIDGGSWITDVGFGGWGLLEPLPLIADREMSQGVWSFRLKREGELWVLQVAHQNEWQDQYAFTLEPQLPIDYETGNHYCSTHPQSRFVQTLTAQRATPERRYILRGKELTVDSREGMTTKTIADRTELSRILREYFALEVDELITSLPES